MGIWLALSARHSSDTTLGCAIIRQPFTCLAGSLSILLLARRSARSPCAGRVSATLTDVQTLNVGQHRPRDLWKGCDHNWARAGKWPARAGETFRNRARTTIQHRFGPLPSLIGQGGLCVMASSAASALAMDELQGELVARSIGLRGQLMRSQNPPARGDSISVPA